MQTSTEAVGSKTGIAASRAGAPAHGYETGPMALTRFAWFVLAYNIAVIIWGAFVRATGSGAGCGSHWPLCNGVLLPSTAQTQTIIEFTHRLTSGLSLVLMAVLLVWCWRNTAKGDWPRYSALAAAILLCNEAILGALLVIFEHVGVDQSASRALFLCLHFGNTLLLVAALALTAKWLASGSQRLALSSKRLERVGIGVGLLCVMATGMTGLLAALGDTIFPQTTLRGAFAEDFSANGHFLLRLRLFHPVVAMIAVLYIAWLVRKLLRSRGDSSAILTFLTATLFAQAALGAINVLLLAPVWLQLTHLLVAELVWILLVLASAALSLIPAPLHPPSD